jgi:hypothetical protein
VIDYNVDSKSDDGKRLYYIDKKLIPHMEKIKHPVILSLNILEENILALTDLPYANHNEIYHMQKMLLILKDNLLMIPTKAMYIKANKEKYYDVEYLAMRAIIFERYDKKCMRCGSIRLLELDHIKPVSKYPELFLCEDNMQILCKPCNQEKSNRNENDYRSR